MPNKSLRFLKGLFLPSKSLGGGIKESSVPLELVSSPLVSAGVDGGNGCISSTELGTDSSDIPEVVAGGVGGPETDVGGVGGKSDASELRDLLYKAQQKSSLYAFVRESMVLGDNSYILFLNTLAIAFFNSFLAFRYLASLTP